MRKSGFTLAEVLITLAIIGVVATMTLPALMTNTGEQQARTALQKGINTLTEAAQLSKAVDSWDYADLVGNASENMTAPDEGSLAHLLVHRTQVDPGLGYTLPDGVSDIEISAGDVSANVTSPNTAVYLRDGSAVYFDNAAAVRSTDAAKILDDGLPAGMIVLYDYNGTKLPNALSTCAEDGTASDLDLAASACNGKKAFIKDIFTVALRGSLAVPAGAAANWAVGNKDAKAFGEFSADEEAAGGGE